MLENPALATLDLLLTTMFWRAPVLGETRDERDADELLAALAGLSANDEETAERISTWLQEERALPAAAAEHIADRFMFVSANVRGY